MEHQKTAVNKKRYFCCECNRVISYGEFKFSQSNFNMPLCRECQPEKEEKVSAPPQRYQLNKTSKIEFGSY
jgi:DNA primase large subunit